MQVSGRTTRSESSRFACSMARMMLAVLVSKSPLVVLIWPIVTRMVVLREIVPDLRHPCNPRPFCLASQHALYSSAPHAEGSHNGSAAVLKTAGRKAMQVRVLSPPPLRTKVAGRVPGGLFALPGGVGKCKKIKGLAEGCGESFILPCGVRTHEIQQFPLEEIRFDKSVKSIIVELIKSVL